MFEMLGSWSFGDYWKAESCRLAWGLVTQIFKLDREKLWVTYFGGSGQLEPDYETRDIWRSLGVPESRLVGLGMSDNFWEMGLAGPCGPCTEIHYSPTGGGGLDTATEIWNIVFIQYDRQITGQLEPLNTSFVDTGMGLERITAILDNRFTRDNVPDVFQTDLMVPMLDHISKMTGKPRYSGSYQADSQLDQAYRVLADHSRMLTVCLADGMFPDDTHRLRNVLRRAQAVGRKVFSSEQNILGELSYKVVDSLGDHFHHLQRNHKKILTILEHEHDNYDQLLERGLKFSKKIKSEFPDTDTSSIDVFDSHNYYESLKCVRKEAERRSIEPRLAFKLYESHGMEEQDIQHLANIIKYEFDPQAFQVFFTEQKNKSKYSSAISSGGEKLELSTGVPLTEDKYKYEYRRVDSSKYFFPSLTSSLVSILTEGGSCSQLRAGQRATLLTEQTNFYSQAGGQEGDSGQIRGPAGTFLVEQTKSVGGYVLHSGHLSQGSLTLGDTVELTIEPGVRLACMMNHTATHLLNSALNSLLDVTAQRSSGLNHRHLRLSFAVFNKNFDVSSVEEIERNILEKINNKIPVKLSSMKSSEMEKLSNLITLPGELYPPEVRLVDVGAHVEPCCGTHLLNTGDLQDFTIVELKTPGPGVRAVKCLTGTRATEARRIAQLLSEEVEDLKLRIRRQEDSNTLTRSIADLQSRLSSQDLPYVMSEHLKSELAKHQQTVRSSIRASSKLIAQDTVLRSIKEQEDLPYFSHYLDAREADKFSLANALKSVPASKPSILLARVGNEIKGKAIVPESLSSDQFSAKSWLEVAQHQLGGKIAAPRGHSDLLNCNLIGGRVLDQQTIDSTVSDLRKFANNVIPSTEKVRRDTE